MSEIPLIGRQYAEGIGDAVANRTINRKIKHGCVPHVVSDFIPRRDDVSLDDQMAAWAKSKGYTVSEYKVTEGDGETVHFESTVVEETRLEEWSDVAARVAGGNASLAPADDFATEYNGLHRHIAQASILMSGRHLQHGDMGQSARNIEVFTNCSTSALSSLTLYLLLNGSGVGRAYDDAMMAVNWKYAPITVAVIDQSHPDVVSGEITALDKRSAEHLYGSRDIHHYMVEDSREGWAKAIEKIEAMAFTEWHAEDVLMLDFSNVRPKGAPIGGMQDRPASGPGPIMSTVPKINAVRDADMAPWRQAMYIDHYLAEVVLVGGARRAARMATKDWRDKSVIEFINIKRPIEFYGLSGEEIREKKKEGFFSAFLWTSNNSVTVDEDFWRYVKEGSFDGNVELCQHAHDVMAAALEASYYDDTGEPGFINQDKLTGHDEQVDYSDGKFAESEKYKLDELTLNLTKELARRFNNMKYKMITNPCGEITLTKLGGYCVIADVVPYHAAENGLNAFKPLNSVWDDDAEDAFRNATRALIRTNTMDALYGPEVRRTNRIGVGFTGFHEWALSRFGFGWHDIVDEEKSKEMWLLMSRYKRAIVDEAKTYSEYLGVNVPHTNTTVKPAGTTSKLFGLTEGAHLPAMREYLRWVQFRNDDPLIDEYRALGYPIRELKMYSGTTIVGFPTVPEICKIAGSDKVVTAAEATPEEQYEYLRLIEKYWIRGVEADGVTPLPESGNQVSYTLKYDPEVTDFAAFSRTLIDGQSTIRCCSVMPQADTSAYEYTPEEQVTAKEFQAIVDAIHREEDSVKEEIGMEHVDCGSGGCPIDFNTDAA